MSDLDRRLSEGRETVETLHPAEDLWARVLERTSYVEAGSLGSVARHQRGRSRWLLAAAAVIVLLALVGAAVLLDDEGTVDTTPATIGPTVPEPPPPLDLPSLEDGGKFRVGNVIVTIQCTGTKSTPESDMRDVVLAGVVTENPDNVATLDEVSVAVGDLLALIIREGGGGGRRVTLYDNTQWYGGATISSCDELVESIPTWVDGGFFYGIPGGYEILPSGETTAATTEA
jgi:hypothetical protein